MVIQSFSRLSRLASRVVLDVPTIALIIFRHVELGPHSIQTESSLKPSSLQANTASDISTGCRVCCLRYPGHMIESCSTTRPLTVNAKGIWAGEKWTPSAMTSNSSSKGSICDEWKAYGTSRKVVLTSLVPRYRSSSQICSFVAEMTTFRGPLTQETSQFFAPDCWIWC